MSATLLKALFAFQGEAVVVVARRQNAALSATYANLADILAEVLPVLQSNGLGYYQSPGKLRSEGNLHAVEINTVIYHAESGEKLEMVMEAPMGPPPLSRSGAQILNHSQTYGVTLTYARRYALLAALGVSTGDDNDAQRLTSHMEASQKGEEFQQLPHWSDYLEKRWESQLVDGTALSAMAPAALAAVVAQHGLTSLPVQGMVADAVIMRLGKLSKSYSELPKPSAGTEWPAQFEELSGKQLLSLSAYLRTLVEKRPTEPQPEPEAPAPAKPASHKPKLDM